MTSRLLAGLVAGAAGTTALNTVTYLDMVAPDLRAGHLMRAPARGNRTYPMG